MTNINEFKGRWRLKDSVEWLDGVLKFSPDEKSSLELFGSFDMNFLDRAPKDIIYGETIDGELITLINSAKGGSRYSNFTNVILSTYLPTYILIGKHFESLESITFTKATFQIFNLFQWLDISGLDNELLNGRYTVSYKEPSPIEFDISSNCKGCISFRSPVSFHTQKIEIEEYCEVSLSYDDVMDFSQVIRDIHILNGFVTLSVFGQTYLTNLSFTDQQDDNKIRCMFHTSLYNSMYKIKYQNELLLKYSDIKNVFPGIVHNWFRLYNDGMSEIVGLLLSLFRDMLLFSDRKFLDAIKALEVFHRRFENNEKMDNQQYLNLLKEIDNSALSNVAKNTILEKMQYGNEPSLHKRIKELTKKFFPPLLQYTLDGKFIKSVVDTRNYLTHLDKSKEQSALKREKLYIAFNNLKALLISCVLKKIEVPDTIVEEALNRKNLVNSKMERVESRS